MQTTMLIDTKTFSRTLFNIMQMVNQGVSEMEFYEFQYALENVAPAKKDWATIQIDSQEVIELRVSSREYYDQIQIKERSGERIVFDPQILKLTQQIFAGLVTGIYTVEWVNLHFYFDIRGFFFLNKTNYYNEFILSHFGGKPFRCFEKKQKLLEKKQDIGYKEFKEANTEIDKLFIDSIMRIVKVKGTPILIAIAGPTAAGKTEIVERLTDTFKDNSLQVTSIELDNFLTDRDYREEKGIFTQGKEAFHFNLFKQSLLDITNGKNILIPRYDFIEATSSHDLQGRLKTNGTPLEIKPADIVFIEGNFPFLEPEIAELISIKVVYLTDDEIRLKRKWKRDIDYRKKYEPTYFKNRFFKDQFIMAEIAYRPQMEICDLLVDTTSASLWVTPAFVDLLRYPRYIKYFPQ